MRVLTRWPGHDQELHKQTDQGSGAHFTSTDNCKMCVQMRGALLSALCSLLRAGRGGGAALARRVSALAGGLLAQAELGDELGLRPRVAAVRRGRAAAQPAPTPACRKPFRTQLSQALLRLLLHSEGEAPAVERQK